MSQHKLRVMSIMAHQDDFEFNAGGTFALLRKSYGEDVELKIITTTRGAGGHHEMLPDDVFTRRVNEARKSAAMIGATYECLTQLDGSHPKEVLCLDRNLLGGLWNAIRAFEPDVVFCPPLVSDPLAGVHVDHITTAEAVRRIAYQVMVPNAFPTINGPRKKWVPIPLIINVDDVYAREAGFHIRQDISETYATKEAMALCHESQIFEWLTFYDGKTHPITRDEWREQFRQRHISANRRHGLQDDLITEFFRITRWGRAPKEGELQRLFPRMIESRYVDAR